MNRHMKLAFLLVPFLLIGGFVLSDLYLEQQADERRVFTLTPKHPCFILQGQCEFTAGEFELNISDDSGVSVVNSTFPLDRATLFIVDSQGHSAEYKLGMKNSPYYWRRSTPLAQLLADKVDKQLLRIVVQIKGGMYIAEFYALAAPTL